MERLATIEALLDKVVPRLERALVATFGVQVGLEAAAAALSVGWERSEQLMGMENPGGYLYTVGKNHALREFKSTVVELPPVPEAALPEIEPGLPLALSKLTEKQRRAILLIHSFGYTYNETAEILEISVSSLRNHLNRGMEKLRRELGVKL